MNKNHAEKPSQIAFNEPSMLELLYGRSVKDRIWVFLKQSLENDSREEKKRITIHNEVEFYELCRGDLIKSKKDKYKPIKAALKKLIETGDVVKVNIKGDPWKSRDEEPWYHFRTGFKGIHVPDGYWYEERKKHEEITKLAVKIYNRQFGKDYSPGDFSGLSDESLSMAKEMAESDADSFTHFLDFILAVNVLVDIFRRPEIQKPYVERFFSGMWYPKLTLTYLPGPEHVMDLIKEQTEKIMTKEKR